MVTKIYVLAHDLHLSQSPFNLALSISMPFSGCPSDVWLAWSGLSAQGHKAIVKLGHWAWLGRCTFYSAVLMVQFICGEILSLDIYEYLDLSSAYTESNIIHWVQGLYIKLLFRYKYRISSIFSTDCPWNKLYLNHYIFLRYVIPEMFFWFHLPSHHLQPFPRIMHMIHIW